MQRTDLSTPVDTTDAAGGKDRDADEIGNVGGSRYSSGSVQLTGHDRCQIPARGLVHLLARTRELLQPLRTQAFGASPT